MHHVIDDFFQLKAGEPGGEHIHAHSSLDAGANPGPQLTLGFTGIGGGHDRIIALVDCACHCSIGLRPIVPASGRLSRHQVCPVLTVRPVRKVRSASVCALAALCLPTQPWLRPCPRSCERIIPVRRNGPAGLIYSTVMNPAVQGQWLNNNAPAPIIPPTTRAGDTVFTA